LENHSLFRLRRRPAKDVIYRGENRKKNRKGDKNKNGHAQKKRRQEESVVSVVREEGRLRWEG